MTYRIEPGLPESDLPAWLRAAARRYGTFPDGRVDYTLADLAPTVMCTLQCDREILIAKRGFGLADAEGKWSTINGFIDAIKPVAAIARQEIKEELGLRVRLSQIEIRPSYTLTNPQERRSYIVFPALVNLRSKPGIKLDHEHTDYAWIERSELETFDILDDLPHAVDTALIGGV